MMRELECVKKRVFWSRDQPIELGILTGVMRVERERSELNRKTVPGGWLVEWFKLYKYLARKHKLEFRPPQQ